MDLGRMVVVVLTTIKLGQMVIVCLDGDALAM